LEFDLRSTAKKAAGLQIEPELTEIEDYENDFSFNLIANVNAWL